jgi:hypothetical protein
METICQKAMEKSADKRYQTAGDLADDLRCFLAGEPIQARRSSLLERVWRKVKREPACTGVTLIALIRIAVATLLASSKSSPVPVPAPPGQPTLQLENFITTPVSCSLPFRPFGLLCCHTEMCERRVGVFREIRDRRFLRGLLLQQHTDSLCMRNDLPKFLPVDVRSVISNV